MQHLYNSTFGRFDVLSVITPDLALDVQKFDKVKPLLLTPFFALCYGISFAILASAISTILLWHTADIKAAFFSSATTSKTDYEPGLDDYEPVPPAWYITIFLINLAAAVFLVARFPLQLPVFGLLLGILLALVFMVPIGKSLWRFQLSDVSIRAIIDNTGCRNHRSNHWNDTRIECHIGIHCWVYLRGYVPFVHFVTR